MPCQGKLAIAFTICCVLQAHHYVALTLAKTSTAPLQAPGVYCHGLYCTGPLPTACAGRCLEKGYGVEECEAQAPVTTHGTAPCRQDSADGHLQGKEGV